MRNDGFHDRADAHDRRERERREQAAWTAAELDRIRDRANNMECLLAQAVEAWPQFDTDDDVNGGDLVEWFAEWRRKARVLVDGGEA